MQVIDVVGLQTLECDPGVLRQAAKLCEAPNLAIQSLKGVDSGFGLSLVIAMVRSTIQRYTIMVHFSKNNIRSLQLLIFLFPFAAAASDFAVLSGNGAKVYFDVDPAVQQYGTADLRVAAPDGEVSTQLFSNAQTPVYPLDDLIPADGTYHYELTLSFATQPQKVTKSLKPAGIDKNGRAIGAVASRLDVNPARYVQSGAFTVEHGAVVPPGMQE